MGPSTRCAAPPLRNARARAVVTARSTPCRMSTAHCSTGDVHLLLLHDHRALAGLEALDNAPATSAVRLRLRWRHRLLLPVHRKPAPRDASALPQVVGRCSVHASCTTFSLPWSDRAHPGLAYAGCEGEVYSVFGTFGLNASFLFFFTKFYSRAYNRHGTDTKKTS